MEGSDTLWQLCDTADADEAQAFLRTTFIDLDARFAPVTPGDVGMRSATAALADLKVVRLHLAAPTWMRTRPERDLNIVYVLGGTFSLSDDRTAHLAQRGDIALTLPDRSQISETVDHDVLTVRLPRRLVEEVAQAETGVEGGELRFDSSRPVSAAMAQHWLHALRYVTKGVLADHAAATNPLLAGEARRLLATAAVAAFGNLPLDGERRPPGDATPASLRRAIAYAEDNADRAITTADMAAAAGVRPRALQYAFRRYRDTTPLQYLRRVRLELAHRDLQAADPTAGTTVAAVAARWGFTNPGRFSIDYRAAYGRNPYLTLRT